MMNSYYDLKWINGCSHGSVFTLLTFCRQCWFGDCWGKGGQRIQSGSLIWDNFLNFVYNFRWLISLCKLQGVQIVNILDQLLFLARTDTGGAQVVSGASFGNCWYSSSDTNYASKKSFGLSSLYNKMSVAATIRMTLKDMIPWSGLSTGSCSAIFVRNAPWKTILSKRKWAAEISSFQKR